MKALHLLPIIALIGLSACSNAPQKSMPSDKIIVSQAGDTSLSCNQLETNIQKVENQTSEMVEINQQRTEGQFLTSSVANVTLALLSPASANNRIAQQNGFSQEEASRLESLKQRHHHLLNIAKDKNCLFAPKVEDKLNSIDQQVKEQTFRQRNHN